MPRPDLETITLGDLTVHRLGYGAMRLTGPGVWGMPQDRDAARSVLRRALALGVNFIDTADAYGPHTNESLIAEALHPYPDDLVIATKGGLERPGPDDWRANARPDHLRRACEDSLRRLRLERIDLYQLHAPDEHVPLEDSIGALADLQTQGKIRHVGVSNVNVDQLARARAIVDVVSVQNKYHLAERASDPVLEVCERDSLAFLPWFPLGGADGLQGPVAHALTHVADALGATPHQVALAWLLARSPVMLPIPGTSSREHLEQNMNARHLTLSEDQIHTLDAARSG